MMFNARLFLSATLATAMTVAVPVATSASAAFAQGRNYNDAFKRGLEEGITRGGQDAERGLRVDYNRHREYRDGRLGWDGSGNRNEYRNVFRKAFVEGYDQGYRNVSEKMRLNAYKGGPVPATQAAKIGIKDGYAQGRDDARRRLPYDPKRALRWRSADHDYHSRWGTRESYSYDYRLGFENGYDEGYRDGRR